MSPQSLVSHTHDSSPAHTDDNGNDNDNDHDHDHDHDTLTVVAWIDPVIDELGHDPRSAYVEQFWLGVIGPSTTWLLRRLAAGLEQSPQGFQLPLAETARSLGLGSPSSRHSPFMRSLHRACQFKLARWHGDEIQVRRKLPPLSRGQVSKLPEAGQAAHRLWQQSELRIPTEVARGRRARRLALSLLELGEDLESVERSLLRWKYQPIVARTAAAWAWQRHRDALTAAQGIAGADTHETLA